MAKDWTAICNNMDKRVSEMMYRNYFLYKIASLKDLMHFPNIKIFLLFSAERFAKFETARNIRQILMKLG